MEFPRILNVSAIPASGAWPLGIEYSLEEGKIGVFSVDDMERRREKILKARTE